MARAVQVEVPADAVELAVRSGLATVDYADAFSTAARGGHSPREWIEAAVAAAPTLLRGVRVAQRTLVGLRLAPAGRPGHPFGWDYLLDAPPHAVLGADGRLLTTRLIVQVSPGKVTVTTLVGHRRAAARPIWAAVAPVHRAVTRYLLGHARPERGG